MQCFGTHHPDQVYKINKIIVGEEKPKRESITKE